MKKIMILLSLIVVLLIPVFAFAEEDFLLAETVVLNGMGRSWAQGYEPAVESGKMTLYFPLTSAKCTGRVTVALRMKDEGVSPFTGSMSGSYQETSGVYRVNLRLELLEDRVNGDYAAELTVSGQDEAGQPLTRAFPLVIRIRDGRAPENDPARPQLSDVQAALAVGEDGSLTATLTNPSRYAAMRGVLLSFAEATGEILPAETDKILLPDLMPGESATMELPLKVSPAASVALHQLQLTFTWTALGRQGEWTETLTLPVSQEMRVVHGSLSVPVSCLQGSLAALSLPVMNMGRAEVRNVLATLVLPGVTDGLSVLLGVIPAGETKEAKLTFMPGKGVLGDLSGEVQVTYEDPWGNTGSFSLPFETSVAEPIVPEIAAEEPEKALPAWVVPTLGGGCGVLALLLMLQGSLLRRKIHRLEEERL